MQFSPLESIDGLPNIGSKVESELLDIKVKYDSDKQFEAAKDVAAFANRFGGTILIGAAEDKGKLSKWCPLDSRTAHDVAERLFEDKARQLLRPAPSFTQKQIAYESGYLVAINIWPSLRTPVAVKVNCANAQNGYKGDAWVFPIRCGTQTHYLSPEEIPMHMEPKVRRALLLLSMINKEEDAVQIQYTDTSNHLHTQEGKLKSVELEKNIYTIITSGKQPLYFPIDTIETIYQIPPAHGKSEWRILAGRVWLKKT